MSKFRSVAQQVIKTGYWVIPIFILSIAGIVIGMAAAKSDYLTSYYGWLALGTRKAEGSMLGFELAQLIAAAPQVLQLIFLYVIGSTDKKLTIAQALGYFLVWLFCVSFDTGTDVYYKAHGMPFIQWVIAFVESVFINTIVSEIALVICVGLSFQLCIPAIKMTFDLFIDLFDMVVEGLKRLGTILSSLIEAGNREVDDDPTVKVNGIRR